jgi:hypothetical protein
MRNAYTVLAPDGSPLFRGAQCECYNFMLLHPSAWIALVYSKTLEPAPLRFAELRLQHARNLGLRARHDSTPK